MSVRSGGHRWDPRAQRPEFGSLYNLGCGPDETLRVFPLSDWTELDVWEYIAREGIEVVPLYFAALRPVVQREGQWIVRDDERMALGPQEQPQLRRVRFRTLGDITITGGIESEAVTLDQIIAEVETLRQTERGNREDDKRSEASMEERMLSGALPSPHGIISMRLSGSFVFFDHGSIVPDSMGRPDARAIPGVPVGNSARRTPRPWRPKALAALRAMVVFPDRA